MKEDAHRLRAGSSAQVMAALRNTAIAVLRLAGFTSTARGARGAAGQHATPPVPSQPLVSQFENDQGPGLGSCYEIVSDVPPVPSR